MLLTAEVSMVMVGLWRRWGSVRQSEGGMYTIWGDLRPLPSRSRAWRR